jgi:hypothetical protein
LYSQIENGLPKSRKGWEVDMSINGRFETSVVSSPAQAASKKLFLFRYFVR